MEISLYMDGGTLGKNPSPVGVYWSVGRQHYKAFEVLIDRKESRQHTTVNEAEYLALLDSLELVREISAAEGIKRAKIHSDSQLIVRQFNGQYKIGHAHLKVLCTSAQGAAEFLHQSGVEVEVVWVPRAENVRRLGH
jgi:ribonuclease HI